MKQVILGFVASVICGATAQARVAYSLVAPSGEEGIAAAQEPMAEVAVNVSEMVTPATPFYATPFAIGGAIFAVLLIGFVLFLKRRK